MYFLVNLQNMNILTVDNLKKFQAPGDKPYPVDIVENLGAYAYRIAPDTFYRRDIDPREQVKVFSDLFTLSPRWVFNIWIDTSHSIYNGAPYLDGFRVYYTDGTCSRTIGYEYDGTSTPEYKHVLFISPENKTVSHIIIPYLINNPTYYRLDSTITPYSEYVNINKKGQLKVGELFESKFYVTNPKNEICNTTFNTGGVVECNQLIEY